MSGPSATENPMSAKIAVSSSQTWLSGWIRPASAGVSRRGRVTSIVSEARRASSAADFRTSRRALKAPVTLSLARLIAAPWVLRSSGDILPKVARSAEIEPFLPSAETRTVSRAASSPAAAIWARTSCSSAARSDTAINFSRGNAAGCGRPGAGTSRPNLEQKPVKDRDDRPLNPSDQHRTNSRWMYGAHDASGIVVGRLSAVLAVRRFGSCGRRRLSGQIVRDGWHHRDGERRIKLRRVDESVRGLPDGLYGRHPVRRRRRKEMRGCVSLPVENTAKAHLPGPAWPLR